MFQSRRSTFFRYTERWFNFFIPSHDFISQGLWNSIFSDLGVRNPLHKVKKERWDLRSRRWKSDEIKYAAKCAVLKMSPLRLCDQNS